MEKLASYIQKTGKNFLLGWRKFSEVLGKINFKIFFTIIYVVFFGIYALARIILSMIKNSKTVSGPHWKDKEYREPTIETLKRQF